MGDFTYSEMEKLSIEAGTPISCFARVSDTELHVTFFAQNGQEDSFCGHGLISVARHLKENNLAHITTLVSASGIKVRAKVLENGMSSLEIPVSGFHISSYATLEFVEFFKLSKNEVIEIFNTTPLGDIVIEVSSPEALKNIILDPKKVDIFSKENNIRIMIFFCKGSSFDFADVEIRVFCSKLYDLEDIVCGSANISVSNILFNKYRISKYKVVQPFRFNDEGIIGGYQEIEYKDKVKKLILNGFTDIKKGRFDFMPLNIEFDTDCNPIALNEDYYFLKSILTDIEVMKTSTFLAGGVPENDHDLHNLMNIVLEKDKRFSKDYGLQKIWHRGLNEYVGVMGLMRIDANLTEAGVLLKSKYIGKGIGFWVYKDLSDKLEKIGGAFISSVWEENTASIKLIKKHGMSFVNKISKSYKNRTMMIEIYIKFSSNITQSDITCIEERLTTQKTLQPKKIT